MPVGIVEALPGLFAAPSMSGIFVFGLLIAVLVLRPQGLFGLRA
jgi:branched-subunit amino acid ABC-type transport system permease component